MSSPLPPKPIKLSPAIADRLADLKRKIRAYVCADGVASTVIAMCATFWCGLFVDWFFEPPVWVRVLMLAAYVLVFASVAITQIVARLRVPLSNSNMALLLERHFERLDGTLITAVELTGDLSPESEGFSSAMLTSTCRRAEKRLARLPVEEVIRREPLRRRLSIAVVALISVVLFAGFAAESFAVWARRGLLFADELWPRNTRLSVEGFENGTMKVARGTDYELVVMADRKERAVPKTVEVRYRVQGGSRRRATMNREGDAGASGEAVQRYSYTFHSVQSPIEFDVRGGDDSVEGLRLEVVESPAIEELSLRCRYPAYMNREPRELPVISTVTEIPYGVRATVHGRADKPLEDVTVEVNAGGRQKCSAAIAPDQGRFSFAHDLDEITEDETVLFELHDTDGIKSREAAPLLLAVRVDQPPDLRVLLHGIGTAVTPQARLPVKGRIADDYGIARAWFEYKIDKDAPGTAIIVDADGNPTEIELKPEETALELGNLGVKAGVKLLIAVKAADRFDLGDAPNEGAGQRWLLDVVTPARLLTILQARELALRQRFEAIIEEVVETRGSLERLDFENDNAATEPNDVMAVRLLRCDRAIQNGRKNANETAAAAEAFDDICLQLINNHIDTAEMRTRLQAGIVDPLEHIVGQMFPELENRLVELRDSLDDAASGIGKRDIAKTQLDAILLEMNEVLGRMMELEDYSQAVALLRSIIDSQKKLGEDIKQRHKAKLHKLLED